MDKVRRESNARANTGDPIIKCLSVLENLETMERELIELHSNRSGGKGCLYAWTAGASNTISSSVASLHS